MFRLWIRSVDIWIHIFIIYLFHRIGVVFYEYMQLKKTLNSLVNTNAIDINAKHPDYIYIKYHIYRESMLRRKHEEQADKVRKILIWLCPQHISQKRTLFIYRLSFSGDEQKWVNVIVHPVGQWWKAIKHSVAWRLLEVAKNGNYHDRLKAVRQLASIDHLKGLYIFRMFV